MISQGIFRQYDIRGVVGDDLTIEAAEGIGRGYATLLIERGVTGAVAVGRDNRHSGASLRDALVKGITDCGFDVVDIGIAPTPVLYWSVHHLGVIGGIQVTGSHNPPEFNGFKLSIGTTSVHGEEIQRLYRLIAQAKNAPVKGSVRTAAPIDDYVADVARLIGPIKRPIKVVVDCGNGVGALTAPKICKALGVDAELLFAESDGTFPNHHPDPTVVEDRKSTRLNSSH